MAKKPSKRERYARFARLAKNPATRASIKTRDLKGFAGADEYRAERAKNARLNAPFVPGGTVSNRDIARERNAAVGLEYGDTDRELQRGRTDSDYQRDTRLPAWFADYQRQLQAGQEQQEAANAAAAAQITQLGQGDANVASQLSPVAGQQQRAAQFGQTVDPQAGQREQDAGRVRQMLNASFGGMLTTQGAGRVGQMIDQRTRIVPGWQVTEQVAEQARGRKIADDQTALAKLKGEFATRYMADARDRESKSVLERAAFGLDEQKLEADVAADRADRAAKATADRAARTAKTREEQRKINQWGFTNAEWRKKSESERQAIIKQQKKDARAPKGKGGKELGRPLQEPASSLGVRRRVDQLKRDIESRGFRSRDEAKAYYRKQAPHLFGSDQQLQFSAALDLKFDGRVSRANLRSLRNNGVFITSDGAYWGSGNRGAP